MNNPKLLVTRRFIPAVEQHLEKEFDLGRSREGAILRRTELLALAEGVDAMFITPMDRLDAEFFENVSSSVKVIATYSVGLDHIDLRATTAGGLLLAIHPALTQKQLLRFQCS